MTMADVLRPEPVSEAEADERLLRFSRAVQEAAREAGVHSVWAVAACRIGGGKVRPYVACAGTKLDLLGTGDTAVKNIKAVHALLLEEADRMPAEAEEAR